jgi:A nuclease family of the HNH/ENDO VII superfamily with conserved AHH
MKQTSCHFPITVRITGTLGNDQIERLAAQVEQAVAERIAAAEGELDRLLGSQGAIVAKPTGPAPTAARSAPAGDLAPRQRPTAARPPDAPGGAGTETEQYTAGFDLDAFEDESGDYWHYDEFAAIMWIRRKGSDHWEYFSGPESASITHPDTVTKSDLREGQIAVAVAEIDVAEEKRAAERLEGLEDLYENIKEAEGGGTGSGAGAPRDVGAKLREAHFESVDEFDDAVRALRVVVGRRAVVLALLTLKESERVLQAELGRYNSPDECNKLATELSKLHLLFPSPNEVKRIIDTHRILMIPVALEGAIEARSSPWHLGEMLRQYAQVELNNIAKSRDNLQHHPDVIFDFDLIIDETLKQMGFGPTSVQAQVIREDRAKKSGRSWSQELFDALLLALSFASGPLGWIGLAARAIILEETIRDMAARQAQDDVLRVAAHTGGKGLASPPRPSGQGWELVAFFAAVAGVAGLPEVRAGATVLPETVARVAPDVTPVAQAGEAVLPETVAQVASDVTPVAQAGEAAVSDWAQRLSGSPKAQRTLDRLLRRNQEAVVDSLIRQLAGDTGLISDPEVVKALEEIAEMSDSELDEILRRREVVEEFAEAGRKGARASHPEGTHATGETPNPRTRAGVTDAEALAADMERKLGHRPPGHHAHHIVPKGMAEAEEAWDILEHAHIGINDAENGVWLPADYTVANPFTGEVHATIHTRRYVQWVTTELRGALADGGPEAVAAKLDELRSTIMNGRAVR